MIRIKKPVDPPPILGGRGNRATQELRNEFDQDPDSFRDGPSCFSFDAKIYGDASVKEALRRAQHGKCAFCEGKIDHISFGDIEHFRPKAGYRQDGDGPFERPGYFWLAYEWANLYLSCQLCNQRHKRNHFPLVDALQRCHDPRGELNVEQPLFLDPGADDPELHISFEHEEPAPVAASARGAATITALGLSRDTLREHRNARYRLLSRVRDLLDLGPLADEELAQGARAELEEAVKDSGEYASMARSLLRRRPLP